MIPVWSSPRPSSAAEQIMPSETRPYRLLTPISKPPGSTAPGRASGTRSPTAKLTAPQMTCRSALGDPPDPVVTRQYLIGFLCPVSSSISSTRATTTSLMSCPTCSMASISSPIPVSRRATSPTSTGSGSGAYSSSQESGTSITPPFRTPS